MPIGSSQYGKQGYGRSGELKGLEYSKIYIGEINLTSSIVGIFSYYPKYTYEGIINLSTEIISSYFSFFYSDIIINNYKLPETFIWDKAPTYQKSYESFFVSDMHYITKENYTTITIQGILEGTSKSDVENKYKDLVDNVIYVDNFVEMKYKNRTYNVFPINVIKTRFEDFPQLLNVTLIYGLKNFKENEWT